MTTAQIVPGQPLNVAELVPDRTTAPVPDLLTRLTAPTSRLEPFHDAVLGFCHELSLALFRDAECRRNPELQSLAFWLRKAELARLKDEFASLETDGTALVPRGFVFHLPPRNVDTTFVYSWILSMLVGNSNIVRLSDRAAEPSKVVCRVVNDVLNTADPRVRRGVAIVQYGHDDEITAAISAACDVRVVWGGNASINDIRRTPLPPHAKEITFCDRYSLAAIRAAAFLDCDAAAKRALAESSFNDIFQFDQLACASPRLVIWIGSPEQCREASKAFYPLLADVVLSKKYVLETAPRLQKLAFAYAAMLDRPVTRYETFGPEVTVIQLEEIQHLDRAHCGGGLLFHVCAASLEECAPALSRSDQTLAHFGFTREELLTFARHLNGTAIDRLVPLGQALIFNRYWDGYDLLREFVRTVYIQV